MLSLWFVCGGVIKFHLSPTHTYTSPTNPFDHDLVVKNQLTNEDRNRHGENRAGPPCPSPPSVTPMAQKQNVSLLCVFHAE